MVSSSCRSAAFSAPLLLSVLAPAVLLGLGEASAAQLTASWTDNSDGGATTRIERRLGTATVYVPIADVTPGLTSYTDASLDSGTTYCYRALAYNAAGVSPYSDEACATTSSASSALSLTVSKTGSGGGTVTSTPAGISCDPTCSATYTSGTSVALGATPDRGSTFSGWSGGGCAGTASCTVAGNVPVTVTASFSLTTTSTTNTTSTDTTKPVVTMTPPSTLVRKSRVTLSATATDNIGVVRVEFYVDRSLTCSDTASLYSCEWRIPAAGNKSYVLEARGYDAAGNVGVSPPITVTPR
jgi:Bacterial Ig domain/Divergent InlB B-repeat domain